MAGSQKSMGKLSLLQIGETTSVFSMHRKPWHPRDKTTVIGTVTRLSKNSYRWHVIGDRPTLTSFARRYGKTSTLGSAISALYAIEQRIRTPNTEQYAKPVSKPVESAVRAGRLFVKPFTNDLFKYEQPTTNPVSDLFMHQQLIIDTVLESFNDAYSVEQSNALTAGKVIDGEVVASE